MKRWTVLAFVGLLLLGGVAVAALSLRGAAPRQVKLRISVPARAQIAPAELAQWIIEGRRDFVVVDMRKAPSYAAGHVKGAVSCGSCHEDKAQGRKAQEGESFVDLTKKLVLYDDAGKTEIELPPILARNPRLFVVAGGWEAWSKDILAPVAMGGETDRAELESKLRREAVRAYFSGERSGSSPAAPVPIVPHKRDNAHEPAAAKSEGC